MARTARDTRLDTRNARLKLKQRREPYWRTIHEGAALGYRKGSRGGFWIARHYNAERGRRFESLGIADDATDADPSGHGVLSFTQAQEKARAWIARLTRIDAGELSEGLCQRKPNWFAKTMMQRHLSCKLPPLNQRG